MYFLPPHIHKASPTINTLPHQRVHLLQLMGLQDLLLSPTVYSLQLCSLWGSLGAGHSEFGQMYKEVYPPLEYYLKEFHCPKTPVPFFSFQILNFYSYQRKLLKYSSQFRILGDPWNSQLLGGRRGHAEAREGL